MAILNAKYNTGSAISGTTQSKNLALATGNPVYSEDGWVAGVQDTGYYVIAADTTSLSLAGRSAGAGASVIQADQPTFWRTADQTEVEVLKVINRLPGVPQIFTTTASAFAWISSSSSYVLIPLSAGDAIRTAIGASYYSAYDAASTGNWIEVNSTAYNNVIGQVSGTATYGTTDSEMNGGSGTSWGNFMVVNPTQTAVPISNYVIAWSSIPSNGGTQIMYTSSSLSSNTYNIVGNSISVSSGSNIRRYFVRKAPNVTTTGSPYFATYSASGSVTKGAAVSNSFYKAAGGSTVSPPLNSWAGPSSAPAFQYIVTSTKSW
jgi:hypothetical protein